MQGNPYNKYQISLLVLSNAFLKSQESEGFVAFNNPIFIV